MKSSLRSIFKNMNGFSMVETLVALGLFGAVAIIGLKQSEMMGSSSNELNLEREIIDFQAGIQGLVNNTDACEKSFKDKTVPFSITNLVDKNDNVAYSSQAPDNTYIDDKLKITSMKVTQKSTNYFLDIEFEKMGNSNSMKKFSKFIELMVEVDPTNKVLSCFNIDNSMDETIQFLVAKNLCEKTYGVNTPEFNIHFDATNKTCSFKGFDNNLNLQCNTGEAMTGISYEPTSNKFVPICSSPFSSLSCPDGWVKSLNSNGQFTCATLSTYIDNSETSMVLPTTCKLMSSTADTQIKLICASNSTSPSLGNQYNCTSSGFSSAGASCTPSNGGPSLCNSGSTVNEGFSVCCASTPSSTCQPSSCVPKGCQYYEDIFKPISEQGCTVYHDDCGTSCKVKGDCNPDTSTFTCMACGDEVPPVDYGCFLAGTEISLFNGSYKSIETISKNDILMGTSGEPVKVESLISFEQTGNKYSINGSRFFVTGSHPFKTLEGWKAFEPKMAKLENPDLDIGQLDVGDAIFTETAYEIVSRIDKNFTTETVYNFQVDGKHEYIADKFQVHNKLDCTCQGMIGVGINCSQSPKQYIDNQPQCASGKKEVCGSCNGGF